jgi:hypothetical protein
MNLHLTMYLYLSVYYQIIYIKRDVLKNLRLLTVECYCISFTEFFIIVRVIVNSFVVIGEDLVYNYKFREYL